jgi:hypothetical protein
MTMELDEALDRLRRIADLPVDVFGSRDVAASRVVLAHLTQVEAAIERARRAALATFDDPMVAPASAATAERILRALDGAVT